MLARVSRPRWLFMLVLLLAAYLVLFRVMPAVEYTFLDNGRPKLLFQAEDNARDQHAAAESLTTHLIVASMAKDDISWTSHVPIPNLKVLRYVNDDPLAEFRPFVLNKGREALMYFTYLHDFYDSLPDIAIFVHAEEMPWHIEGTLLGNMTFALSRLDLDAVARRRYFNLRTAFEQTDWTNTSKTVDNWDKKEEPFMKEAWQANFGEDPPEMLGGACCAQFAVTREAIRSRPREQYRRSRDWLAETDWHDYFSGRVWEHMWPYLFKNVAIDDAPERASLCEMYGLCFASDGRLGDYKALWKEREYVKDALSFFHALYKPGEAAGLRKRLDEIIDRIGKELSIAWENGQDKRLKASIIGDQGAERTTRPKRS